MARGSGFGSFGFRHIRSATTKTSRATKTRRTFTQFIKGFDREGEGGGVGFIGVAVDLVEDFANGAGEVVAFYIVGDCVVGVLDVEADDARAGDGEFGEGEELGGGL